MAGRPFWKRDTRWGSEAGSAMASDIRGEIISLLPRLRRFARGLSRSQDEADDLVQGACERALRSIDSFEVGTRLDSWMFRILRNLWIDQTRRAPVESLDESAFEIAGEDGPRVVEARMELNDVRAGILALPNEQREVLVLICVEDMSYRDAAQILQIPIGTVMSRLSRARQALDAMLSGGDMRRVKARGTRA